MRAEVMVVGERYAAKTPGRRESRPAVLVSKETGRRAYVRVRFEEGLTQDRDVDIPSSRIVAPWRESPARRAGAQSAERSAHLRPVPWIPTPGTRVACSDTGLLHWTVEAIDFETGMVSVTGTPLTQRQRRQVAIHELGPVEIREPELRPEVAELLDAVPPPPASDVEDCPTGADEAIDEDEDVSSVADRFMFSPDCCEQYRKALAPRCRRPDVPERMRQELRKRGKWRRLRYEDKRRRRGEYIRYQVPGRFEIVLFDSPSRVDSDIYVKRIRILKRRDQPKRRRRRRRRR